MLYTTFARQNHQFLSRYVHKLNVQLEGEEDRYELKISLVTLPPEDEPLDYLSKAEKEQYYSFKYPRRRNSYILGKLAAKMAVAGEDDDLTGIQVDHGILCQPIVTGRSRGITITHCDDLGAAIDYDPRLLLGVDMELVDEKSMDALRRITTKEEEGLIHGQGPEPAMLTLLWTAKEAMSKVIQTGFTVPTELFEIKSCVRGEQGVVSQFTNFPQFKALSVLREKYVFTVVLPKKAMTEMAELRFQNGLQQLLRPF